MPKDKKERALVREKIHIVLRGPDGLVKDEQKPNKNAPKGRRKEYRTQ